MNMVEIGRDFFTNLREKSDAIFEESFSDLDAQTTLDRVKHHFKYTKESPFSLVGSAKAELVTRLYLGLKKREDNIFVFKEKEDNVVSQLQNAYRVAPFSSDKKISYDRVRFENVSIYGLPRFLSKTPQKICMVDMHFYPSTQSARLAMKADFAHKNSKRESSYNANSSSKPFTISLPPPQSQEYKVPLLQES